MGRRAKKNTKGNNNGNNGTARNGDASLSRDSICNVHWSDINIEVWLDEVSTKTQTNLVKFAKYFLQYNINTVGQFEEIIAKELDYILDEFGLSKDQQLLLINALDETKTYYENMEDNNNSSSSSNNNNNNSSSGSNNVGELPYGAKTPGEVIRIKLLNSSRFDGNLAEETIQKFERALATSEGLRQSFLNFNWEKTVELESSILSAVNNNNSNNGNGNGNNSNNHDGHHRTNSTNSDSKAPPLKYQRIDEGFPQKNKKGQFEYSEEQVVSPSSKNKKLKVKLVLVDLPHNAKARDVFSPIMSMFDISPQFGMFHTALTVGPWIIDWTEEELCIPRKIGARNAILSADIKEAVTMEEIDVVMDKLAEGIVHWNTHKGYQNRVTDKKRFGNCQDFTTDILHRMGIELKFNSYLEKFLKRMRDRGKCKLTFAPSTKFCKAVSLVKKQYTFTTHSELDLFVNKLEKIDCQLKFNFPEEYSILKAFDRAFWLRHLKLPQDPMFAPLTKSQAILIEQNEQNSKLKKNKDKKDSSKKDKDKNPHSNNNSIDASAGAGASSGGSANNGYTNTTIEITNNNNVDEIVCPFGNPIDQESYLVARAQ